MKDYFLLLGVNKLREGLKQSSEPGCKKGGEFFTHKTVNSEQKMWLKL